MTNQTHPRVFTIIPAAGLSRRMGQCKQVLPFGTSTILQTAIETVLHSNTDGLVVVTNPKVDATLKLSNDPRYRTVILEDDNAEMLDSILLGTTTITNAWNPSASDAFMVSPGDMPGVTTDLIHACAMCYRNSAGMIVVAGETGKPGHPIVVPFAMLDEVRKQKEHGLKGILKSRADAVRFVPADSPLTQDDIDTPDDYQTSRDRVRPSNC